MIRGGFATTLDASHPGGWMLHCHIAEDLGSGMMAVMHVDP